MKIHFYFSDLKYWNAILHYKINIKIPFTIIKQSTTGRGTLILKYSKGFGENRIVYNVS